jgi:undecaprenyl-diphosphatase
VPSLAAWIAELDVALLLRINHPAGQNGVLDRFVFDLADSPILKGGLFMAVYWWLWFERDEGWRRHVVVAIVAGTATAVVSRLVQVGLPFHQRPLHTPGLGLNVPLPVDPETLNTFSSFPSDHAMLFFALSVPLWRRAAWLGVAAMLWTALVICLPRIYLGYHYPSDVLAGAILGVICMLLLSALARRTRLPDQAVRLADQRPAAFYAVAFIVCFELATLFADARHLLLDVYAVARMMLA